MPRISKPKSIDTITEPSEVQAASDTPKVTPHTELGKAFPAGNPSSIVVHDENGTYRVDLPNVNGALQAFRAIWARLQSLRRINVPFGVDHTYITDPCVLWHPSGQSMVAEAVVRCRVAGGHIDIPFGDLETAQNKAKVVAIMMQTGRCAVFETPCGEFAIARVLGVTAVEV